MHRWFAVILAVAALAPAARAQAPRQGDELLRALESYRRGNCKEAEPLLEGVLKKQPRNLAVRKLLGHCLLQDNRVEEARAQYRQVLEAAPQDAEAIEALRPSSARIARSSGPAAQPYDAERQQAGGELEQAERLIKERRLDEAEKLLVRLTARLPDLALPRLRLAEIYSATRRFGKAAEAYRVLAARAADPQPLLLRAAQNLAWAKSYAEASQAYETYLKRSPADAEARLALANIQMWTGHFEEAAASYQQYLERKPANAEARISLARVLTWSKRYDDALRQFEQVLAAHPGDAHAELGMAQCYEQLGRPEPALEAYQRVLKTQPQNVAALEARRRLTDEIPRKKAFTELARNDNAGAARYFLDYLRQHPDSDETVLQAARALAWSKQFADARKYYQDYLTRKPHDEAALRELAKTEMAVPDLGAARLHYEAVVSAPGATIEDYEALIHAYTWDGKPEGAQPYAQKLARLDADNAVAREAMRSLFEKQRMSGLENARTLASAGRYTDALEAYRQYSAKYGADREIELAVCRLYGWDKQAKKAEAAYNQYLRRYPGDTEARLELADVQKWAKEYDSAETQYHAVLRSQGRNSHALLGLAQISDYRGTDPFASMRGYRRVLTVDPNNVEARQRIDDLVPQVSPSMGYNYRSFGDSDGFYRSLNTVEAAFPFAGGLKLTPFYTLGYFHQYRAVGGASCASPPADTTYLASTLNDKICGRNGTFYGNNGGIKLQVSPAGGVTFTGEIGAAQFSTVRTSLDASAQLLFHSGGDRVFGLTYIHRSAVYDVNTIGALAAGIMGDSMFASYQQRLGDLWRLWTSGGVTRYNGGIDNVYGTSVQRRFSARLDYQVLPNLTAGYSMRLSSFTRPSEYYFSPERYMTYGLAYGWSQPLSRRVRFTADGEIGFGHINRVNMPAVGTLEMSVLPALVWQVRPDLEFRFGYRFSRGRSSTFGSPVYSTGGADFGLQKYMADHLETVDPTRLDVH